MKSSLTPGTHTNKLTQVALWPQKELRHMQDHKHICTPTQSINTIEYSKKINFSYSESLCITYEFVMENMSKHRSKQILCSHLI